MSSTACGGAAKIQMTALEISQAFLGLAATHLLPVMLLYCIEMNTVGTMRV